MSFSLKTEKRAYIYQAEKLKRKIREEKEKLSVACLILALRERREKA